MICSVSASVLSVVLLGVLPQTSGGTSQTSTVKVAPKPAVTATDTSTPTPAAAAPAPLPNVSASLKPSLQVLQQALTAVHADRWKAAKPVREATLTNVASIHHDLDDTLPGLLATADASPGSLSAVLPLQRNLGALYDVVLRVTVIAESSAPQEQTAALEQAMTSLEGARRTLSDRVQTTALAQEQQVKDLQKTIAAAKAQAAAVPATPAAKDTSAAAKAKAKKKKPVVTQQ